MARFIMILAIGAFEGGGIFNNVDILQNLPDPAEISSNQIWPDGFPTKPEHVFSNYPNRSQTVKEFA